jgi:hypothetical protein
MKAIVFCTAMLLAFGSTAQAAGLRDRCAGSTGATMGAAFDACISAGIANANAQAQPSPQPKGKKKSGYKSPGDRAKCRMGHC